MDTYLDCNGDTMIVRLKGELDQHYAAGLRTDIDNQAARLGVRKIVFDFTRVGFMDSSGIALIIGRAEICRSYGGRVEISGLCGTMRRVVMLSGIQRIKNIRIV